MSSDILMSEKRCSCRTTITSEHFHTGLVPESPTFFNSSPFKVLSPQPPKFLKSLLPVKEENKAKKALEARPLLGQEVRKNEQKSLFLKRGSIHLFLCSFPFILDFSSNPHILVLSVLCQIPFLILPCCLSLRISPTQHGKYTDISKNYSEFKAA